MRVLILITVLALTIGCAAKTHKKGLAYLEKACAAYVLAEGVIDATQIVEIVDKEELTERVEKGRKISRSACYALAKFDEAAQLPQAAPED